MGDDQEKGRKGGTPIPKSGGVRDRTTANPSGLSQVCMEEGPEVRLERKNVDIAEHLRQAGRCAKPLRYFHLFKHYSNPVSNNWSFLSIYRGWGTILLHFVQ